MQKKLLIFLIVFGCFSCIFAWAQTETVFFVDKNYDSSSRNQIGAFLHATSSNAYFYLEGKWYFDLEEDEKTLIETNLAKLINEFDKVIYPEMTSSYGFEWKPGIDNDEKITVLFHKTKAEVAGYFRNEDEYPRLQSERSNEREMVYLNAEFLKSTVVKSYLAHEFTHLITFNQKERKKGVMEMVWLNEARAEYAPSLLGYDEDYQNSNLKQRVSHFLASPSNSLIDWEAQKADYGVISLFIQYLAEKYGAKVINSSFESFGVGIGSLNEALKEWNTEKSFADIFTDWTIAVFLNDCAANNNFCYQNENLKNIKVPPYLIFLPTAQKTSVSLNYSVKSWAGNWYRIIGGEGDLKVVFEGKNNVNYKVPYVLCDKDNGCEVDFLSLDELKRGELSFENFGKAYSSLTLIPSVQPEGGEDEDVYSFSLDVSLEQNQAELIAELQRQIAELQRQIAELVSQINAILAQKGSCKITSNLYLNQRGDQIRCLQEFLKTQPGIYPEGLVTGYFGFLTRAAVVKFQEKYKEEILFPLGLQKGTGYVGNLTRAKINSFVK